MEGDGQGSVLFCLDEESKNLSRSQTLSGSVPLSSRETRWGKGKQRGTERASPLCLAEEGARQGSLLVFRGQKDLHRALWEKKAQGKALVPCSQRERQRAGSEQGSLPLCGRGRKSAGSLRFSLEERISRDEESSEEGRALHRPV